MSTFSDAWNLVCRGFFSALQPDPDLTVSEWADARRYLSSKASAEPGEWRTSRTPYLKEPMDALSANDPTQEVVLMFGSQLGKSELGNNWIGYTIDIDPCSMLAVQPTGDIAKRFSTQRLAPLIADSPTIRAKVMDNKSRDAKNTMLTKEFRNGILMMTGSNSAAGLKSMPIKKAFSDEIDTYPLDCDGEGDPIELIKARTATFARRKLLWTSTPTEKGSSAIERMYEDTDQRKYFVPCPHCGHYHTLEFENFKISLHADGSKDIRNPYMVCVDCGGTYEDWHKSEMLARGEWRAMAPEKSSSKKKGYHLNALYSPVGWFSWSDIAGRWVGAQGNKLKLKSFVNTILAQSWEERGEKADVGDLVGRCIDISEENLPDDVHVVTVGVDVQRDRIELEYIGWCRGEASYSLGYKVLEGDPTQDAVWLALDIALSRTWVHSSGVMLRAAKIFIDSGDGVQMSRVYDYARSREGLGVYACKGSSDNKAPICGAKSYQKKAEVYIYLVGVVAAKDLIYGRLSLKSEGPGYCFFSKKWNDKKYFDMLTAEERFTKGDGTMSYKKIRTRNESLDCRVYGTAALYSLGYKVDEVADYVGV